MFFITARSIITPPSVTARPATLCPPLLTDTSNPPLRANASAATTSWALRQRTITAGLRSTRPLCAGACRVIARIIGGEHRTGDTTLELVEKMVVKRGTHVAPFC